MPSTSITDVRTIGINISNQDEALAFYVNTLGFEVRLDAPISPTTRWIEVAPPCAGTSIHRVVGLIGASSLTSKPSVFT